MKTHRNVYIISGITLVLLNLLIDVIDFRDLINQIEGTAYNIGYIIGSHFLLILESILLRMAYKLQIKINQKEDQIFERSIESIGKQSQI